MGRISQFPLSVDKRRCLQCEEVKERGGYWQEGNPVTLCGSCARDPKALGALLADALFDNNPPGYDFSQEVLVRFERSFWKALYCAEVARKK